MNIIGGFDSAEELLDAPAEEATLITALLSITSRHLLPDLFELVKAADFFDPHLGSIWGRASQIVAEGGTVSKRSLLVDNKSPAVAGRLQALSGEPVRDAEVHRAAGALVEVAKSRRLVQALKRSAEHAALTGSYSEALQFASEQLSGLSEGSMPTEASSFADAVDRWQEWVTKPEGMERVVETPWDAVNELLAGGLHPGRSYVIGGRPGEGKSIALLNFAQHGAENGHPSVVFSIEMGEAEVVSRIVAAGARAEYGQMTRHDIDEYNHQKIAQYIDTHRGMPLTLVDKADISMNYIRARCRTLKRTTGLDVIVVDYLQLITETDSDKRQEQVAKVSKALKVMSRELDCAVVVACQLNRNAANQDRKPTLTDLRESGSIEQDADVVMLLHHEVENGGPTGMVEVIVAKNRTGKQGSVPLPWRAYQARLG